MTYNNAVKHINALPIEAHMGSTERLRGICAALNSPQKQLRTIQIFGDAGKNSCSEMLSAVLAECGYSVGCLSLPHASELREKIRVGGKSIPHAEFAELVKRILELPAEITGDEPLSQSEMLFLVSLMYFSKLGCDAVIFERSPNGSDSLLLDAPLLTIVTSIFDNVSPVPFEEMIHRGTPETVSCIQHKDIYSSISKACAEAGCRLTLPIYADLEIKRISLFKTVFIYRGVEYSLGTFSPCQLLNAITVIEAAHALARLGASLSEEAIAKGLSRAHLPLLCKAVAIDPTIIVAAVSNEKQLEAFIASLAQVRELLADSIGIFVSPDAEALTADISAGLASCSLECESPLTLEPLGSPELKAQINGILLPIVNGNNTSSTTVFIGSEDYISELSLLISKSMGGII